jgi:hypothetical protein
MYLIYHNWTTPCLKKDRKKPNSAVWPEEQAKTALSYF